MQNQNRSMQWCVCMCVCVFCTDEGAQNQEKQHVGHGTVTEDALYRACGFRRPAVDTGDSDSQLLFEYISPAHAFTCNQSKDSHDPVRGLGFRSRTVPLSQQIVSDQLTCAQPCPGSHGQDKKVQDIPLNLNEFRVQLSGQYTRKFKDKQHCETYRARQRVSQDDGI